MNTWLDTHALWQILVYGLICGAGLPAVFALGLRALSRPPAGLRAVGASDERAIRANPLGIGAALLCFLLVLTAIGCGIYLVVAGS